MIVDVNEYKDSGFQESEKPGELEKALARAERLINLVTAGKCGEFDTLHKEAQKQLKFAVCAQAEKYIVTGFSDDENTIDCKVKIGDFSYESKNNGVINSLSPAALSTLKLSGLLYAGTEVK